MQKNNIGELKNLISGIIDRIESVSIPFLKEIERSNKRRIHNKGLDSSGKDVIGRKSERRGRYSPGYEKKKRAISGDSNLYPINLQLSGNLLRSQTVGTEQGKPVLKFQDGRVYPISPGFDGKPSSLMAIHEKRYNTSIVKPSGQQMKDGGEVLKIGVDELIRSLV